MRYRSNIFIAAAAGFILSGCVSKMPDHVPLEKSVVLSRTLGIRSLPESGFITDRGEWASEQTEFTVERTSA